MNPSELRKHLAEYADGELDPAQRAELEAHLAQDPASQADVARWQALRQCAHRALAGETVPPGLDERLRARLRAARHGHTRRLYRFGVPGLAAAAAIVLALFLWPKGAEATSVHASGFASVYRHCAVERRHDALQVRNATGCKTLAQLRAETPLAAGLPDLARHGYQLDGACWCAPPECTQCGMRVLHVYYRRADDPNDVVSAFAMGCRLKLCSCSGTPCAGCRRGAREFQDGTDGDVTLVSWTDRRVSYVLAGRLPREQLAQLAEGAHVTLNHEESTGACPGLAQQSAAAP
jgi:anti-sigma factor RsiW